MREFEALRAEVYHRGEEKKIKIKKNRRRLIALCVPLVLCVTAVSLLPQTTKNTGREDMLLAPEYGYAEKEAALDTMPAIGTETVMESQEMGSDVLYDRLTGTQAAVEVTSAEGWVWYSRDAGKIQDISEALHAIPGEQTQEFTGGSGGQESASLEPGSYRIVFTDRDGKKISYLLTREYLEVVASRLRFAVTARQYAELERLLAP